MPVASFTRLMPKLWSVPRQTWFMGGAILLVLVALGGWFWLSHSKSRGPEPKEATETASPAPFTKDVRMDARQQDDLGIVSEKVSIGSVSSVFSAPGQVVPDESQFAYITPRAKGIIRDVHAQIGQFVKKDDLLVTIDSSEVAQARLRLIDALTRLELARAKLNWQETIYRNGLDMIEALRMDPDPDQVQLDFAERPVGRTREQLLTAYAQFHLSKIAAERYDKLSKQDAVPVARAQQQRAAFQVDRATFQGLMDRMTFEITLAYTQARQELRESRTAVKVARETLRVYGVSIEQIAKQFEIGELTGEIRHVEPQATLRAAAEATISPSSDISELMKSEGEPVSTYELRAPFDGTVLERERIVPGLVVDGTNRMFTMAGLDTVWVEAHVHESDFDLLNRSKGGRVTFTSPAYPDEQFEGHVLYTGNLVDQKSRMVRMLATAENPAHKLNPGMFVTVEIHSKDVRKIPKIRTSALLTDNDAHFVFVQTGAEQFERRQVEIGRRSGDEMAITRGLDPGERVVVEGAFALKGKSENKE